MIVRLERLSYKMAAATVVHGVRQFFDEIHRLIEEAERQHGLANFVYAIRLQVTKRNRPSSSFKVANNFAYYKFSHVISLACVVMRMRTPMTYIYIYGTYV